MDAAVGHRKELGPAPEHRNGARSGAKGAAFALGKFVNLAEQVVCHWANAMLRTNTCGRTLLLATLKKLYGCHTGFVNGCWRRARVGVQEQRHQAREAKNRNGKNRNAQHRAAAVPITVRAQVGLGFHLREAYRAFSRQFHARLANHDITHAQWVVLWLLSQSGSLTPIGLAREAGIQKASATSVIESLKRRKLIRGVQDADDRRRLNLSLTLSGAALMKSLIACAAEANALGRAGLTEDEITTLLKLLRTVTANFENAKPSTAK